MYLYLEGSQELEGFGLQKKENRGQDEPVYQTALIRVAFYLFDVTPSCTDTSRLGVVGALQGQDQSSRPTALLPGESLPPRLGHSL